MCYPSRSHYAGTQAAEYTVSSVVSRCAFKSRQLLTQKVETHGGKPSGWVEFIAEHKEMPGVQLRIRQYFTLHRGNLYMIMITTPYASWNQAKPHWVKVIRSMEFL